MRGIGTRIAYIVLKESVRPAESGRSDPCRIGVSPVVQAETRTPPTEPPLR